MTLIATKAVRTRTVGGAIREAMTMSCELVEGHVEPGAPAARITHSMPWMGRRDVVHQVLTARVDGPDRASERQGLARFAGLFVGNLWDVAARKVLAYAPF